MVRIWEQDRVRHPKRARLPVILPVVLVQNAKVWKLSQRFSALQDLPAELRGEMAESIPDFVFRLIQLAELPFDKITGTPAGILTLRMLKASQLLDDPVWDEALWHRMQLDIYPRILRYIFSAPEINKNAFGNRLTEITTTELRESAMTREEVLTQRL